MELFKLSFEGNVDIVVPFVSGKLTGKVYGVEQWFGQPNLSMLGHFEKGQLVGPVWKLFEENGFLVMDNFEFTGKGLYIYPGKLNTIKICINCPVVNTISIKYKIVLENGYKVDFTE